MYKLLLCLRYLRTRYIALICIISITLGVATLIVVNSVMAGFGNELRVRMNDVVGDLIVESRSMDGVPDAENHIREIQRVAGDSIAGITPTVELPALMYITTDTGKLLTRQIMLLGIDERTFFQVSNSAKYLQHPKNREGLSFALRESGYDTFDHEQSDPGKAKRRYGMEDAGWKYRREMAASGKSMQQQPKVNHRPERNPFASSTSTTEQQGRDFDPAMEQHVGVILGIGTCSSRDENGSYRVGARPGSDIKISFPKASLPPEAINERYTVVDLLDSKWFEFDQSFAIVPLRALQSSRGMIDPTTGIANFTSLRIKLKPDADPNKVKETLLNLFGKLPYEVFTWQEKRGALLSAIQTETVLLNILLFMIIAVAGFGILAIFCLIVVEKTKDIGILKSLGASKLGIMGIFLSYGLALGFVGSGGGFVLGLIIVRNINEIKDFVTFITGRPVFDPQVYFLSELPTVVHPFTICWVIVGAMSIAILASIIPAWRAARLHPVKALRYE